MAMGMMRGQERAPIFDYVYTLDAVRGRLRRGRKSVKLFMPYSGVLVTVTKKNFKKIAARYRGQFAETL